MVTLPLVNEEDQMSSGTRVAIHIPSALHILVVDDEPLVRETLAESLRTEGHGVVEADDGMQALAFMAKQEFDVVFLDVMMPGMNGLDLFKEIRSTRAQQPVVFCSGYSQTKGSEVPSDGLTDYIVKPFSTYDLVSALGNVLPHKNPTLDFGARVDA